MIFVLRGTPCRFLLAIDATVVTILRVITMPSHAPRFQPASCTTVVALQRALTGLVVVASITLGGCVEPAARSDEIIQSGLRAYHAEHYREAIGAFQRAAALDRESAEPSFYMGRCYLAMAERQSRKDNPIGALRNSDRAIACFDDAINVFPGFSDAVEGKAEALKLKGEHAAALELADWAAEQSGPQAKKLILKAHLYARSGDMDQAQLAFKQATSVEPDNAAAHAELGLFYLRCGNKSAAIECLKRAYALNAGAPGVVTALMQLGAMSETSAGE